MNMIEGIIVVFFAIGTCFIINAVLESQGLSYRIYSHQDYEIKYNQSQKIIDSLNEKLSVTEDKLSYCEDYKNIRTDWSGISIWISGAIFYVIVSIYMQKRTRVK